MIASEVTGEGIRKFGNGFARADVTDVTDFRNKEECHKSRPRPRAGVGFVSKLGSISFF